MAETTTRESDRDKARRLKLPSPLNWSVSDAQEARGCSGHCTARYEHGVRVVDVPQPCPAHGSRRA